ncbi:MAG: O-antigen polymerase [Novosphingobium sp.]
MYQLSLGIGLLFSMAVLFFFSRHRAFSLFHPLFIYTAFHFLVFVIRPIFAFYLEYESLYRVYQFSPTISDKITVIAAANLGYAAFAFASLRAGSEPVRFRADRFTLEERRRLTQLFTWAMVICAPLALYSLANNFSASGNYDGMVLDRGTGVAINTKGNGYITDGQLMLAPMCAIFAWLGRFRLISLIPMALFVLVRGSTGGRGPLISALVIMLLLYLYEKRLKLPALRLALAGVAVASLFSFIGEDRGHTLRVLMGIDTAEEVFSDRVNNDKFMEAMDIANMEFFEYIVWVVPQRSGTYDYFLNNLQVVTEPIPRVLWPGKPIGSPIQMVRLWDYGSPIGMTSSLPGMGWYSLGWIGVLIWCGLWGHILGSVYRRYWDGDQSTIKTAAYMVLIASLIVSVRDGGLLTMVKQTGAYIAPVLVWLLLAKYMRVPSLAQLRAQAFARMRKARERALAEPDVPQPPASPAAAPQPETAVVNLPAAVRRRRLALLREEQAATKA